MVTTYFTLEALAIEWNLRWAGARLADVYSQRKGELVLVLERNEQTTSIRVAMAGPLRYVMAIEGVTRARRNVVSLLESAVGRHVERVSVADLDRMLFFDLDGGTRIQVVLFGPRPNVFLLSGDGSIVHAFKGEEHWVGSIAPAPRAASMPSDRSSFLAAWREDRRTLGAAVSSAVPLFDAVLAEEAAVRAGLDAAGPAFCPVEARERLYTEIVTLLHSLNTPSPRVYETDGRVTVFSLVPLRSRATCEERLFDTVSEAVAVYVRRKLVEAEFESAFQPLHRSLVSALEKVERRIDAMEGELAAPSRSERYEHWGHLLMASLSALRPGESTAVVPDVFSTGEPVSIPLDPALSAVENAQSYYARARRNREARRYAEERMEGARAEAQKLSAMIAQLEQATTRREVEAFRREFAGAIESYVSGPGGHTGGVPFRRLLVDGDLEVWVGRNAGQNDALTLRHARKFDLWFHARGVSGSHVVLRLPGRAAQPTRVAIEQAAAIAAFFSEAKTSGLVPVQMAERKYVRKPKGAPPGAVVVEREEVLLVEPGLPGSTSRPA